MEIPLLAKLYSPLLFAVTFLIMAIFFNKKESGMINFKMEKFGFNFEIPISKLLAKKIVLLILAIVSISLYVFYDFSTFFPHKLEMKVFYDKDGIDKNMTWLSESEKINLNIISNYELERKNYYNRIDSVLKTIINQKFFSLETGQVHSEGKTTFIVEPIDGIQKYEISEAEGEVTHQLEAPNQETIRFRSFFSKIESPDNLIELSLKEVFFKQEILINPQFREILAENNKSMGYTFDHILYGVTKIYFFPYPKFGNTLYLLKVPNWKFQAN